MGEWTVTEMDKAQLQNLLDKLDLTERLATSLAMAGFTRRQLEKLLDLQMQVRKGHISEEMLDGDWSESTADVSGGMDHGDSWHDKM